MMVQTITAIPKVTIKLDGVPLTEGDARMLVSVRVQQQLSLPTLCEMTFKDPTGPLGRGEARLAGVSLTVEVEGGDVPLFTGEITAMEYGYASDQARRVRLRGYDRLHRLRKQQPVRVHVEITAKDIAEEMLSGLGIMVQADMSGPVWPRVIQHRQSDFELLAELASRAGLFFSLRREVLHLFTLEGIGSAIKLELGTSLLEANIEVNGDTACDRVITTGWDPWSVQPHEGEAGPPRSGRDLPMQVRPSDFGGSGERRLVDEPLQDDRIAESIAQGELDHRTAREIVLWGVADGNPGLQPGTPVEISGLAASLCGRFVISAVNHTIDAKKGFISEINTTPPLRSLKTRGMVASLGIVSQIDDPEEMGRIKVCLPTYAEVESDWLSVLTVGAGTGKGLIMQPDIDDQVLVLLEQGDPAQGIVLGGLYGTKSPPDWGIDKGSVKRFTFQTPGGQRLQLDDARNSIRLEISEGSYLEMTPERVLLHAEADIEVEAPGKQVLIKGKRIDFQQV